MKRGREDQVAQHLWDAERHTAIAHRLIADNVGSIALNSVQPEIQEHLAAAHQSRAKAMQAQVFVTDGRP